MDTRIGNSAPSSQGQSSGSSTYDNVIGLDSLEVVRCDERHARVSTGSVLTKDIAIVGSVGSSRNSSRFGNGGMVVGTKQSLQRARLQITSL